MIPEPGESLSLLMGASGIADRELIALGISIVARQHHGIRGLLIPDASLPGYRELIRDKLSPGFWNETIGRNVIRFQFKLADGTLEEITYSPAARGRIAHLCSQLNREPPEKTADVLSYLAGSRFYRDLMHAHHGVVA